VRNVRFFTTRELSKGAASAPTNAETHGITGRRRRADGFNFSSLQISQDRNTYITNKGERFKMLAVRLPKEIDDRLSRLARETGRTKSYYVREALLRYLDDLEDAYLVEAAYERFLASKEEAIPIEEVERNLGLEG